MGVLKSLLAIITGKMAVTYVHTSVRKIVFPIAIFLNAVNQGCGILGAEYRKVIMAEAASQYQ
jgi:CRISPR/Cas system-associated protein Csm6